MKKTILDRYAKTDDGRFAIDITTGRVSDLYNNFDKTTPYAKKELDEDLVNYLIESAREIGNEEFVVRFHFNEYADDEYRNRVTTSVHNYFSYMKELEGRILSQLLHNSLVYLVVGIAILFLSVWANSVFPVGNSVLARVSAEGLTVAAWVSLWQGVAAFLINWRPYQDRIHLYKGLSGVPVLFE
jgi:hypothetical protein